MVKDYALVSPIPDIRNVTVDFVDEVLMSLNRAFVEDIALNNGTITDKRTIQIDSIGDKLHDRFDIATNPAMTNRIVGDIIKANVQVNNLPTGYDLNFYRLDSKLIEVEITGVPSKGEHHFRDTINDLEFLFDPSLFQNGVGGRLRTTIQYVEPHGGEFYPEKIFQESRPDGTVIDGEIHNQLTLDLYNLVLSNINHTALNTDTHLATNPYIRVENLPAGLVPRYTINPSLSSILVSFDNVAGAHADVDDVDNLRFHILPQAFPQPTPVGRAPVRADGLSAGGTTVPAGFAFTGFDPDAVHLMNNTSGIAIDNKSIQASVNFVDRIAINVTTNLPRKNFFLEHTAKNDGSIENEITLEPAGGVRFNRAPDLNPDGTPRLDPVTGTPLLRDHTSDELKNLININPQFPDYLTPEYRQVGDQAIVVKLLSKAVSHQDKDDRDFAFNISYKLLSNGTIPLPAQASINFIEKPIIQSDNKIFRELNTNVGAIGNNITIDLKNDYWRFDQMVRHPTTGNIIPNPTRRELTDHITRNGLISNPTIDGLSPEYEWDATQPNLLTINLVGNARDHDNVDDTRLNMVFDASLFEYSKEAIEFNAYLDFVQAPVLSISPEFKESENNDGTISNSAIITVAEDEFNIPYEYKFATSLFKVDSNVIEKLEIDGINILEDIITTGIRAKEITVQDVIDQIGYHTNGTGVTTVKGNKATIYARNVNGDLNIYSNDIAAGDGLDFGYKFKGYNYKNLGNKVDDPNVLHIFRRPGAIAKKDIGTHILTPNMPNNLEPTYAYVSPSEIEVKLLNRAVSHSEDRSEDVDNLRFDLQSPLFVSKIPPNPASPLEGSINFIDKPTISVRPSNFAEVILATQLNPAIPAQATNAGFIRNRDGDEMVVSLVGDEFSFKGVDKTVADPTHAQMEPYLNFGPFPKGLTPIYSYARNPARSTRLPKTHDTITIKLVGQALSHTGEDSLKSVNFQALAGAFASQKPSNIIDNISVEFEEEAFMNIDRAILHESGSNDGRIDNKYTLTLSGGAKLLNNTQLFKYGYGYTMPFSIAQDLSISGTQIRVDKQLTGKALRDAVIDYVNNSGQGTLTNSGRLYAKVKAGSDDILF